MVVYRRAGLLRKSVIYLVAGISTVAIAVVVVTLIVLRRPRVHVEDILAAYQEEVQYSGLTILYPLNETLFPPGDCAAYISLEG